MTADANRVLLIDDDAELSAMLGEYIANEGYAVERAADRAEPAWLKLSGLGDCVYLCWRDGRMNRYDARERLGAVYMHELTKQAERVDKILPVVIRADTSVKNAIFDTKSIFELPRKAPIREDIDQFTKEVLGINAWKEANATAGNT